MRILLYIFSFLLFIPLNAQNRDEIVDVGPEFKALFNEFDSCIEDEEQNCIELLNQIIEKGKQEKVPFLDYLYFKKAFYFKGRQELDSSMVYAQLAIDHPNPEERQRRDLSSFNLLATGYQVKGDLNTALDYHLKNVAILEDGGNPLHLGYTYSNIALLLGETGNQDKYIEYLLKSYKLLDENNDDTFIATIASNLAGAYHSNGKDTVNVNKWARKTIELSELYNDKGAKARGWMYLALIEEDIENSLEYAGKAVKFSNKTGKKSIMSSTYYVYAHTLSKIGRDEEALEYAAQAVDFAQEVGNNSSLLRASYMAGSIFFKFGRKEKAADYFHTYAALKESISSAENAKEINEIQTKYETEKKEKRIAEQRLKIQKQRSNLLLAILSGSLLISILGGAIFYNKRKQQVKLKQLQQEKENAILNSFILGEERERKRISHELHDGVAAMIGAAKMSLESIPYLPREKQLEQFSKVKDILENTHADVRHIAHNLLPTVLEKEGLIKATSHFASEINETKLVKISVTDKNSNAQELSPQLQLMLFRVIQELVNNIIKHSQAENAEIAFSNSPNGLQIEISDDGIGYEDINNTGNQGLYSITQRLKSIGGNFKITKRKSGGTQAKVVVTV